MSNQPSRTPSQLSETSQEHKDNRRERDNAAALVGSSGKDRPFGEPRSSEQPFESELRRAQERGRGRGAYHPFQIPWEGWKDILWRTYDEMTNDRLLYVAGGVAFFVLLAIFPAITALVSAYGLFFKPSTITDNVAMFKDIVPDSVLGLLKGQIAHVAAHGGGALSIGFVLGILVSLWSAMSGVKAVIDALNVINEQKETRSFVRFNLAALVFTLGGFAAFLFAVAAVIVLPLVLSFIGLGHLTAALMSILRWPVLFLMLLSVLAILYRHGPDRATARWRWLSVGSVVAALMWIAGSYLFSWYLSNFANYSATYGSLGAAVGLMMWLYISAIVVLVGAELNAEIEHQTARDSTVGEEKPLGRRGAVMADTVGAKQTGRD
jgi:membrane protein